MQRDIDWLGVLIALAFITSIVLLARWSPVETIAALLAMIYMRSGGR